MHSMPCHALHAMQGLRESIPPNFPYFYIQFGYGSGYVHVIDNEEKFDPGFGRQVCMYCIHLCVLFILCIVLEFINEYNILCNLFLCIVPTLCMASSLLHAALAISTWCGLDICMLTCTGISWCMSMPYMWCSPLLFTCRCYVYLDVNV